MKRSFKTLVCAMTLMLTLGIGAPGCQSGLDLDTTIGELLGELTLSSDTTIGELLSVLTSGDLASAFDQFVGTANDGFQRGGHHAGLTAEQLAEIESLQAQLNDGTIDENAFDEQVRALLGDSAPTLAFGGFGFGGSPFGMNHSFGMADPLDLTEEQQAQADEIFEQLHADIADLRSTAHEDIQAVLTDEQLALLPEISTERFGFRHRGFGGPRPGGFGFEGEGTFSDRFAEALGLTDAQQSSIDDIREKLRTTIMDRHMEARDAFVTILTADQLETLESFEADHEAFFGADGAIPG